MTPDHGIRQFALELDDCFMPPVVVEEADVVRVVERAGNRVWMIDVGDVPRNGSPHVKNWPGLRKDHLPCLDPALIGNRTWTGRAELERLTDVDGVTLNCFLWGHNLRGHRCGCEAVTARLQTQIAGVVDGKLRTLAHSGEVIAVYTRLCKTHGGEEAAKREVVYEDHYGGRS